MNQTSIITITLNPAIDKSTSVEKLIPEAKLRCAAIKNEPGGGGINVSKALKKLGTSSLAVFTSGGHNGSLLQDLLQQNDIPIHTIAVEGETRENFVVLETSTNHQYRFNMPGVPVAEAVAQECLQLINDQNHLQFVVASGSLPQGINENFYADMARRAREMNIKFIVDTSGKPLQLAVEEGVYLVKPNLSELTSLVNAKNRLTTEESLDAARQIINKGRCEVMVVSLGEKGALLVTPDFHEHIATPKVKKQSTVGAGDSMVAGMIHMLSQNKSFKEMVRFGVACGTAATMNPGTELFNDEDVMNLYNNIK